MKRRTKLLLFGGLISVLILITFIGLEGWKAFIIPNIGKISTFSLPILLGFAFIAGIVSFFAPCSFALFPGYVAFYLGTEEEKKKEHPAKLGLMASLGVVTFFILLSIVFIVVGKSITRYLGFIAPTIGFLLILFGILLFSGYAFKTSLIQKFVDKFKSEDTRSKRNIFLFGFAYGAVSLGCTLPLVLALIIIPIMSGKILTVFLSLLVYAFAMSLLMILVTYLVAWSEDKILKKMVQSTATIKKISGIILIIIGAYLIYYNIIYSMLL